MKNWPKIQYNQVQFGINASLEINEKACDCSLFTGRRYVMDLVRLVALNIRVGIISKVLSDFLNLIYPTLP